MGTPPSGMMPPPGPAPGMYPPPKPSRPVGVTILAVLAIIFGILALIGGLGTMAIAGLAATIPELAGVGTLLLVIGALVTIMGLLYLVSGIGLLRLRGWAWWLAIIASVLSIVSQLGQYAMAPVLGFPYFVVLPVIILIYLVVVRGHFGIGAMKPAGT